MNDLQLYQNDVDLSIAKRLMPRIETNWYYAPENQVQPWHIYRHVEMMDKHLNSFRVKTQGV